MKKQIVLKENKGVSLLEVMIAVFIFSIAALGFTHLKLTSLQMTQDAHNRMAAEGVVGDFKRIMESYVIPIKGKVNIDEALADIANENWNSASCNNGNALNSCLNGDLDTPCSREDMLSAEAYIMACNVKTSLPKGNFNIDSCSGKYCIYVSWHNVEANEQNCSDNSKCIKGEVYY